MSFKLTQAIIDIAGIPLACKAVLLVLARHALDDGSNAKCPSVATIAEKAGMSDKGARNALRSLEAEGWIEALGRKVGGRAMATNYRIVLERLGPDETRNDVPGNGRETRNHVPANGHDRRNYEPRFHAETRNDVQLNPERRSAEYITEEIQGRDTGGASASAPAHVHVHEAPSENPVVKSAQVIAIADRRSRPCDPGWSLPADWYAAAVAAKHPRIEIAERRFRSHWRLRRAKCLKLSLHDLRDEWDTWVLEDIERERRHGRHSGSQHDALLDGLAGTFGDCMDAGSAGAGGSGGAVVRRIGGG